MIKKTVLSSILIILCFCPGFSQIKTFTPEWGFGVNGGTAFSRMRFSTNPPNPSISQDYLMQFSGGIVARYISQKHFGIQGELNYSMRGWKETTDEYNPNKYSRRLTYLELPIMTHIYFDMGKWMRFFVNLGPQIGFNIGDSVLEKEIVTSSEETSDHYDLPVDKKFDYGIKAGIGFEIRTGIGSFIVDGRYYFGLSDTFGNTKEDYFQASSHQALGVNLTYLFRLK